jgi:hypothetical protein
MPSSTLFDAEPSTSFDATPPTDSILTFADTPTLALAHPLLQGNPYPGGAPYCQRTLAQSHMRAPL